MSPNPPPSLPARLRFEAALFLGLLMAWPPSTGAAQAPSPAVQATGSPAATLQAERDAVLAAETLDDVIDWVPAEHRERVGTMSEEEKEVTLARWKSGLETATYEERVAGDRAAVLVESEASESPIIMIMERDGDRWVTREQTQLFSGVAGARGSFVVSGAVEATLEGAHIQQNRLNGVPFLSLRNELAAALDPDAAGPALQLVLDECLAPGEVDLGIRSAENVDFGSSFQADGGAGDPIVFRLEPAGTLRVETADDERFSGSFELSVGTDEADAGDEDDTAAASRVTISGTIENARNPCDEADEP